MGIIGRLEEIFVAAAFAEAGEHEKAKQMLEASPGKEASAIAGQSGAELAVEED